VHALKRTTDRTHTYQYVTVPVLVNYGTFTCELQYLYVCHTYQSLYPTLS